MILCYLLFFFFSLILLKPPLNSCGLSQLNVQRMRYLPSREPGTCILCHSIYLQVIKVHWFKQRTTDESLLQKSKRFRSLCRLRIPVKIVPRTPVMLGPRLYSRIETARHLVRSDFLQRSTQNFEIRRRVPRVKKNWRNSNRTHTSLSTCRSADAMFTLTCLHQSLSLSLYICKHGLNPDQTRMVFRIECFVNLKSVKTVECATLSYKSWCARKVWVLGPHRKQL